MEISERPGAQIERTPDCVQGVDSFAIKSGLSYDACARVNVIALYMYSARQKKLLRNTLRDRRSFCGTSVCGPAFARLAISRSALRALSGGPAAMWLVAASIEAVAKVILN